jgi:phosphohistidine phosphatase
MTSLYLLRHAKAAAAAPGMRDFDRPLDRHGVRDARLIGKTLAAMGVIPQTILCSSSLRTRQTLEEIAPFMPFAGAELFSDALYSADARGYLTEIMSHGHNGSLMVIGHNPSTEELASLLVSSQDPESARQLKSGFPTGALAHFKSEGGLSHLKPHSCALAAFLRPKDLRPKDL